MKEVVPAEEGGTNEGREMETETEKVISTIQGKQNYLTALESSPE